MGDGRAAVRDAWARFFDAVRAIGEAGAGGRGHREHAAGSCVLALSRDAGW
ncbi:MAG: hypothetical protein U1F20_09575 [Lysobacterales bacterium]